jgi:hypothetical protein
LIALWTLLSGPAFNAPDAPSNRTNINRATASPGVDAKTPLDRRP